MSVCSCLFVAVVKVDMDSAYLVTSHPTAPGIIQWRHDWQPKSPVTGIITNAGVSTTSVSYRIYLYSRLFCNQYAYQCKYCKYSDRASSPDVISSKLYECTNPEIWCLYFKRHIDRLSSSGICLHIRQQQSLHYGVYNTRTIVVVVSALAQWSGYDHIGHPK